LVVKTLLELLKRWDAAYDTDPVLYSMQRSFLLITGPVMICVTVLMLVIREWTAAAIAGAGSAVVIYGLLRKPKSRIQNEPTGGSLC
jgi:hypothetical protein